MRIGVPKETAEGERRVALVPEVVRKLAGGGHEVVVEAGAGEQALLPDALYTDAGAQIGDPYGADVVVRVAVPSDEDVAKLRDGQILVGFLAPLTKPELKDQLRSAGVQALAMESIPRISRAQSMDALSSQANVGGYKAALLGAEHSTRFYPMLMTAAGTIPPAKVLVLGAGVAGLQALATARPPRPPPTRRGRRAGSAPRRPATTCARRSPSRSSRSVRRGWTSASRRPARAATRANSATR